MSRHRRRVKKALKRVPSYSHGGTLQAGSLQASAHAAAEEFGLDWNRFNRQLIQESGYQPGVGSSAGALGVGQFMPLTWRGVVDQKPELARRFGVTNNPADRTNGVASIYFHYKSQVTRRRGGRASRERRAIAEQGISLGIWTSTRPSCRRPRRSRPWAS